MEESRALFTISPSILWFLFGAILILIELVAFTGVGFLFAGIGAVMTGILIIIGVIAGDSLLYQFSAFLISSSLIAAILWRPLKRFLDDTGSRYSNIIGESAELLDDLAPYKTVQAKWSGTIVNVKFQKDIPPTILQKGDTVYICHTEGTTMVVSPDPITIDKKGL